MATNRAQSQPVTPVRRRRGSLLGKLWTLPNTVLGVVLGLLGVAYGARIQLGHNALLVLDYPLGNGALTLGNVVLYARCQPGDCRCIYQSQQPLVLGLHEEAHTLQYEALGPLFLPLYFLCGGISGRNRFERAANAYAAGGSWWPWSALV